MPNFLLVPIGTKTGLTSISLGLVRALQQSGRKPAYFKPVAHTPLNEHGVEAATHFAAELFLLNPPQPLPLSTVESMIAAGNTNQNKKPSKHFSPFLMQKTVPIQAKEL